MQKTQTFTAKQLTIVQEIVLAHNLEPTQISFDGDELTPIFDYEAVCALSLKLTDIQSIDCGIWDRQIEAQRATARCTVTLPDGRSRTCEDSAQVGESYAGGETVDTMRKAENVAQARAVRRGVRSVGINLYYAHNRWIRTGKIAGGHLQHDPRYTFYQEIHALAEKLGFIVGDDRTEYENLMAATFEGRTSSKDLNDIELQKWLSTFRSLSRVQTARDAERKMAA